MGCVRSGGPATATQVVPSLGTQLTAHLHGAAKALQWQQLHILPTLHLSQCHKQASVPRGSPACLDVPDERQSLYCFPPGTLRSWAGAFLTPASPQVFSSSTQWGFTGLKILSLKMPKWIPHVQILKDIKGERHTWTDNTLLGLVYRGLACNFPHFHSNKKRSLWLV